MYSTDLWKSRYQDVIDQTSKVEWRPARIEDYPHFLHKRDPEEFALYITKRKSGFQPDAILIHVLAKKFDMEDDISCHEMWKKKPSESYPYYFEEPYLWVRKTSIKKVREVIWIRDFNSL